MSGVQGPYVVGLPSKNSSCEEGIPPERRMAREEVLRWAGCDGKQMARIATMERRLTSKENINSSKLRWLGSYK